MASLTLKNVPDDLLSSLRKAAEGDRRSVNQEILYLLSSVVGENVGKLRPRVSEVDTQVAAWRRLAGQWKSDVDPAMEAKQLIRRRSRGREVDL
jgi:hypothetical protein